VPDPLILAGPQVRRVTEEEEVTIWLALSASIESATLDVYAGPILDLEADRAKPLRTSATSVAEPLAMRLVPFSDRLIFVAVRAKLAPLAWDALYSYNVQIVKDGVTHDLKSLGFLQPRPPSGLVPECPPLGYAPNKLSSFLTAGPASKLRIAHGSCRKTNGDGGDALASVDKLIATGGAERPAQLLLTGDQIYADDVSYPLSPWLTKLGERLLMPAGKSEKVPVCFDASATARLVNVTQSTFRAGSRFRLTQTCFTSKVQRLPANVSTYMILDDHEVTDDWNRTRRWQRRAYSTPSIKRSVARRAGDRAAWSSGVFGIPGPTTPTTTSPAIRS